MARRFAETEKEAIFIPFERFARIASNLRFAMVIVLGCTLRGSCNRALLRRVLRRFFKGSAS